MTDQDQELTHGDRTRMLVAAIVRLLDGQTCYDPDEPLSIMKAACIHAGMRLFAPATLTGLACTEIMEADAADLYAACSEAAPQLREAR